MSTASEPTQGKKLQDFYGSETATMYAGMMEAEMKKYTDDFALIFETLLAATDTPIIRVLDTCVGSGHMLKYIGEYLSPKVQNLELRGRDLSPDMIQVAKPIVPPETRLDVGNMLDMSGEANNQYQLVLNNFAMHHATAEQAAAAIQEYARILAPRGCLFFSAWEGTGQIDYGDSMNMSANNYSEAELKAWVEETAGLTILKCRSFVEVDMGNMNSVYIIAQKK